MVHSHDNKFLMLFFKHLKRKEKRMCVCEREGGATIQRKTSDSVKKF